MSELTDEVEPNIVHEAEHTRQHARFMIPSCLLINNQRYPIRDLSVAGFSVSEVSVELGEQSYFKAEIEFDFEVFKLTMCIEAEKVRFFPERKTISCRFSNMSKGTLSLIHSIISTYLAGDVVTAGSLIHVVSRENFTKEDLDKRLQDNRSFLARLPSILARWFGNLVMLSLFLSLIGFLGVTAYKRLFIVDTEFATVSAPTLVVRAPGDGLFSSESMVNKGLVAKDTVLGMVKFTSGGAVLIHSPCNCTLVENHTRNGGFVGTGEPMFTFVKPDTLLLVEAEVNSEEMKKISITQRAEVLFPDGRQFMGSVVDIKIPEEGIIKAMIKTDQPLPLNTLGQAAQARIYTLNQNELIDELIN